MLFSFEKISLNSILERAEKETSPFKDEALLRKAKTMVGIPDKVIIGPKHYLLVESDLLGRDLEKSLPKPKSRP